MIQTHEELLQLARRAFDCGCVALDTEFVWERTFYPRLGLIQAGLPDGACFLVDATVGIDLAPLGEVIAAPQVTKILHDANQDLTILHRATGAYPRTVFDTRCAAGFVGLPATISLQELLAAVLGVNLTKTETRTDWLRRPLSDRQTAYALDDVRYLPRLREELLTRARGLGHESWLQEELAGYDDPALYDEREPRLQYERIKGAGRLSGRRMLVLRELAAWREVEARNRDLPRDHIIADRTLVELALRAPRREPDLAGISGLSRAGIARYGATILRHVSEGLSLPRSAETDVMRRRRRPNVKRLVDRAFAVVRQRCAHEKIDPGLVTTRTELSTLAHGCESDGSGTPRLLHGWRQGFVGKDVVAVVARRPHEPLRAAV